MALGLGLPKRFLVACAMQKSGCNRESEAGKTFFQLPQLQSKESVAAQTTRIIRTWHKKEGDDCDDRCRSDDRYQADSGDADGLWAKGKGDT